MSILINMEMPNSCGDCKAFVCYRQWAGDVGDCFCGITKNDAEAKKKNADCPLVPVPPHGRLIDADALMRHKGGVEDLKKARVYLDWMIEAEEANGDFDDEPDDSQLEMGFNPYMGGYDFDC